MLVETVGLLGDVSREQAMASLLTAPLLEDLAEWSQWELVFQPNHGSLKQFIEKYCSTSPLTVCNKTVSYVYWFVPVIASWNVIAEVYTVIG